MKLKSWVGLLLGAILPATMAHAASVGINFTGKPSQPLSASTKVGVVPQKHWNNLTIDSSDPNGHSNGGSLAKLKNDAGKVVKGMSVMVEAAPGAGVWAINGATWGFSGSKRKLEKGLIWPHPLIKIKGIPYKKYNVYVYVSAGNNAGLAKVHIAGQSGKVDSHSTYFCRFNWQGGNFAKATTTTLAAAKRKGHGGNYVEFKGNTAKDIDLNCNGALASWVGFSAVQIVSADGKK